MSESNTFGIGAIIKISLLSLIFFLIVDSVYADGWHLSNYQLHMEEPNQKAVISWDGQTETMILSSAVKSDEVANFAWVIPIQSSSKPEVSVGNISIFEDLVDYFKKEEPYESERMLYSDSDSAGVNVLESKEIDIYDITILQAASSEDLIDWLNSNGYQVPEEAKPIIDKYVAKGDFYFVANKIDLTNKYKNVKNVIDVLYKISKEKLVDDTYLEGKDYDSLLSTIGRRKPDTNFLTSYIYRDSYRSGQLDFFFLNKDIFDKLKKQNSEFIAYRWHSVAESFEELNPFYHDSLLKDKTPGIYCYTGDNTGDKRNAPHSLIYSIPEMKSPSVWTHCDGISEKEKNEVIEKIPEFYQSYLNTTAEILEHWNKFEHILISNNTSIAEVHDLYMATENLKKGIATPLKFEFQPHKPYYPLEISSLNLGESIIEVYMLAVNPVTDKNGILTVEESKKITQELKNKIEKHIPLASAEYVTRLSYKGDLKGLTNDAELDGKDIMKPPSFPDEKDLYEQDYNFLQKVWNWISNLFG